MRKVTLQIDGITYSMITPIPSLTLDNTKYTAMRTKKTTKQENHAMIRQPRRGIDVPRRD